MLLLQPFVASNRNKTMVSQHKQEACGFLWFEWGETRPNLRRFSQLAGGERFLESRNFIWNLATNRSEKRAAGR